MCSQVIIYVNYSNSLKKKEPPPHPPNPKHAKKNNNNKINCVYSRWQIKTNQKAKRNRRNIGIATKVIGHKRNRLFLTANVSN